MSVYAKTLEVCGSGYNSRSIQEYKDINKDIQYGFCSPIFSQLYSANLLQSLPLRLQTMCSPFKAEIFHQLRTCYPLCQLTVRDLLPSIRSGVTSKENVSASIFRQQGALRVSEFRNDLPSQCSVKVASSSWYQGISSSSSLTPHGEKAARANKFTNCA